MKNQKKKYVRRLLHAKHFICTMVNLGRYIESLQLHSINLDNTRIKLHHNSSKGMIPSKLQNYKSSIKHFKLTSVNSSTEQNNSTKPSNAIV